MTRRRVLLAAIAAILLVAYATSQHSSAHHPAAADGHTATVTVAAHAAPATTTPTSTTHGAARPSPGPMVMRFLTAYARFYDGDTAAGSHLPGPPQVTAVIRQGGQLPARRRHGSLHVTDVTGIPSADQTEQAATVTFALESARYTLHGELVLTVRDGRWSIAELNPPDPDRTSISPARSAARAPAAVPTPAQAAAATFVTAYLAAAHAGLTPAGASSEIAQTIAAGHDPLAAAPTIPTTAGQLTGLAYGPDQSGRIACTVTVTVTGRTIRFGLLLALGRSGRWQAQSFLGQQQITG